MKIPKPLAVLHEHVDGSLRVATTLDIARREGIALPATNEADLYRILRCGKIRDSLADYLSAFPITTSVMQSYSALVRIASELMEDDAEDGVLHAEPRFMPSLHTKHGLREEAVMEAVLDGLTIGGALHGVSWGLIVCSMRHVDPAVTGRMIDLAIRYKDQGVVAVDLAGDDNLPALDHAKHYRRAKDAGLYVTIHAGEAGPVERIEEAIDEFGADRIGHGVKLIKSPRLIDKVRERKIGIEACLTSNIQIKTVGLYTTHPAWTYLQEGLLVSLNTDNRMLADTTATREHELAKQHWHLSEDEAHQLVLNAIKSAFIDDKTTKLRLIAEFHKQLLNPATP